MARTSSEILVGRTSDLPNPPPQNGETITITTAARQTAEQAQRLSRNINIAQVQGDWDLQKSGPQKI